MSRNPFKFAEMSQEPPTRGRPPLDTPIPKSIKAYILPYDIRYQEQSKWHSTSKSILANLGHKPATVSETPLIGNLNDIVLKIQEPLSLQVQEQCGGCTTETLVTCPVPNLNLPTILLISAKSLRTPDQGQQRKDFLTVPFLSGAAPKQLSVKKSLLSNSSVKNAILNSVSNLNEPPSISNSAEGEYCLQVLYPESILQQLYQQRQRYTQVTENMIPGSYKSHTELSGATPPPVALVEENKVPVFIDEYKQQSTQPLTPALTLNNKTSNVNGNTYIEERDFDIDIEMITKDSKSDLEKMDRNNHDNNFYYGEKTIIENKHPTTYNSSNIAATFELYNELDQKEEPQYLISPGMAHYNLSEEVTSLGLDAADVIFTEEAIDINAMNNDNYTFADIFCSSQSDPMLTEGLDNFSQKLTYAEPVIPNIDYDAEYAMCIKQQESPETFDNKFELDNAENTFVNSLSLSNLDRPLAKRKRNTSYSLLRKRNKLRLNTTTKQNMNSTPTLTTPDVINLIVDWGKTQLSQLTFDDSTTTQDIIEDLLDIGDSSIHSLLQRNENAISCATDNSTNASSININHDSNSSFAINSISVATTSSLNIPPSIVVSPSCCSVAYTDEEHPYTPQSFSSINRTFLSGDYDSSPNSSTFSTNAIMSTTTEKKKKRGRPCKQHSDRPDAARLKYLPGADRKRAEDRAKNNEASRLSRLKNKLKEEAEAMEVKILTERNTTMKDELDHLIRVTAKLKQALQRRHFKRH